MNVIRAPLRRDPPSFVWMWILDASPLDAAEGLSTLRVLDRVEEQTGIGALNVRIGSHRHPEAATMLKIDGRASTTARADDDHFRRLVPAPSLPVHASCLALFPPRRADRFRRSGHDCVKSHHSWFIWPGPRHSNIGQPPGGPRPISRPKAEISYADSPGTGCAPHQ